jgi:serine-type D-Ala-D-Ala carboxypeptidase (penicillin-binding protein 5/6)
MRPCMRLPVVLATAPVVLATAAAAVLVGALVVPAAQLAVAPAALAAQAALAARAAPAGPAPATPPAGVVAAAGELVNAKTASWMWSRQLNVERPIASLTKVMTAIVVIESGDLSRKITVTAAAEQYAEEHYADSADLVPGDVLTAWQLLEGMLLPSGADAAYLLANSYGPGWQAFVGKMNATARRLGMTQTHFANFDGLPWPTEYTTYSTPRDVIIMGAAAMKLAPFRQIVAERSRKIGATSEHHAYYWKNTNLLLGSYRGAIGIKTGFTLGAGYCLLFEAKRGSQELMGVVLDSTATDPSLRFIAATRLLNWGFAVTGGKPGPG